MANEATPNLEQFAAPRALTCYRRGLPTPIYTYALPPLALTNDQVEELKPLLERLHNENLQKLKDSGNLE
jgi:hypothetical protein